MANFETVEVTTDLLILGGGFSACGVATEAAYRAAGIRVLHTGRVGAVRVVIDPTGVTTKSFSGPNPHAIRFQ